MKKIIICFYLLFVATLAFSQWDSIYGCDTVTFNSVHFPDSNTGYIVGGCLG